MVQSFSLTNFKQGKKQMSTSKTFFVASVRRHPCGNGQYAFHHTSLIKGFKCANCTVLKAASPEKRIWLFQKRYEIRFSAPCPPQLLEKIPVEKRTNTLDSYLLVTLKEPQLLNFGCGRTDPGDFLLLDQSTKLIWHVLCDQTDLLNFEKCLVTLLEDSPESPRLVSLE